VVPATPQPQAATPTSPGTPGLQPAAAREGLTGSSKSTNVQNPYHMHEVSFMGVCGNPIVVMLSLVVTWVVVLVAILQSDLFFNNAADAKRWITSTFTWFFIGVCVCVCVCVSVSVSVSVCERECVCVCVCVVSVRARAPAGTCVLLRACSASTKHGADHEMTTPARWVGAQNIWVFFIVYIWLNPPYYYLKLGPVNSTPDYDTVTWCRAIMHLRAMNTRAWVARIRARYHSG